MGFPKDFRVPGAVLLALLVIGGLLAWGLLSQPASPSPVATAAVPANAVPISTTALPVYSAIDNGLKRPTTESATRSSVVTGAVSSPTRIATTVAANLPSLTEKLPERTIVRTFTDVEGRQVRLTYGRGTGYNGDYGWAHIYGKHVQGIWYDGGTVTTFGKTLGTKSPEEVVALLAKSVQDRRPDSEPNGRRSYVYPVPNTNSDVFMVVGDDGTVITAYPVRRGSKDGS